MANQISAFLDPTQMPARTQDQNTFDSRMASFFATLSSFGTQFNAGVASFNAAAAGSAYAIPYTIDLSGTSDVDPGNGKLRFDNATQNAATTLRLDLLNNLGKDCTAMLDMFDASTNPVKGAIRIVMQGDATKFLVFNVTARSAPSGYRDISVTPVASSSANPFANGDAVLLCFQSTGDKGNTGAPGAAGLNGSDIVLSTTTISSPVVAVNLLSAFSSTYNRYVVELEGITMSPDDLLFFRGAVGGVVQTSAYYTVGYTSTNVAASSPSTQVNLSGSNACSALTATLDLRNVNDASNYVRPKTMGVQGAVYGAAIVSGNPGVRSVLWGESVLGFSGALSGFQLYAVNGNNITGGTIRVIGKRNT
jgi:hypothetical protein